MQDYFDEFDFNNSTFDSISEPTFKNELIQSKDYLKIEENIEDYPIRCPTCWRIPLLYSNLNENNYAINCEANHKNIFMSFDGLIDNTNKKFGSLLCNQCKKESDLMYQCTDNNLFYCPKCKEKSKSKNFIEIKDIDTTCPIHKYKFKFYDTKNLKHLCSECHKEYFEEENNLENLITIENYVNYKDTIDRYSKKAAENIKMWNSVSGIIKDWLKNFNDKYKEFLSSIGNYCILQQKLVNFLKKENNYLNYNNNFHIYSNYVAINNEKADSFIRSINNYVNFKYNKNSDICTMSKFFIDILDEFYKNNINIESKIDIKNEEKGEEKNIKEMDKKIKLLKHMNKKKFELDSKITSLIPFNKEKNLILGLSNGDIIICETKDDDLMEKLKIKEFDKGISHLCEIDKNLFAASDITNNTKIIQIEEDFNSYTVIKYIILEHDNKLNKIISLPIISYFKNRNYLAIALEKEIIIYKSNKMPTNLEPPYTHYHAKLQEYSIDQPSSIDDKKILEFNIDKRVRLESQVKNILEINDKYLAVICENSKNLILVNTQKDFNIESSLHINIPNGDCYMKVAKSNKEFVIAYNGGLIAINLDNFTKVHHIKLKQNLKIFDFYGSNNIMFLSLKNDDIYIKQYKYENGFREITKLSEIIVLEDNQITNFFIVKNKIYYINNTNLIHYYE